MSRENTKKIRKIFLPSENDCVRLIIGDERNFSHQIMQDG